MSANLSLLSFDSTNSGISKRICLNSRVDRVSYYEKDYNTFIIDFIKGQIKYENLYKIKDTESYKESLSLLADIIYLNFNKLKNGLDTTLSIPIVEDVIVKITPDLLFEIVNKCDAMELIDVGVIKLASSVTPPLAVIETNTATLSKIENILNNVFEYLENQSLDYYGENIDYTF